MLGFGNKRPIEDKMAEWLAHPNEFGVRPKAIRFKRTYRVEMITYGNVALHLVEYEMPDGTRGRGVVNDSLTWSFLGNDVNAIADDQYLIAYCGWAWLFPALQGGTVQTEFESQGAEDGLKTKMQEMGLEDIKLNGRYKIGDSELFEFSATQQGKPVKGAGNSDTAVLFESGDTRMALPSIYFLLGNQVIQRIR